MKMDDEQVSTRSEVVQSLQMLLEQMLEQSCSVFSNQQTRKLNKRLEELDKQNVGIVDLLSQIFSTLIRKVQVLNSKVSLGVVESDYEVLESAVQKCEGEIRKHIRIEQQLKLYSDSLEEKLENYEKIVESEKIKNAKTSDLLVKLEKENKDLVARIKMLQRENDGDITRPKKHSKIMSEVSFQDNGSSGNIRSGIHFAFDYKKRRRPVEKLNIRSKPISREKSRVDCGQFQIAIDRRQQKELLKKRHSVNINNLKQKVLGRPYPELFDMHRTLNVSEDSDKRKHSKKRHTEVSSSTALRKEARCNSVCK